MHLPGNRSAARIARADMPGASAHAETTITIGDTRMTQCYHPDAAARAVRALTFERSTA